MGRWPSCGRKPRAYCADSGGPQGNAQGLATLGLPSYTAEVKVIAHTLLEQRPANRAVSCIHRGNVCLNCFVQGGHDGTQAKGRILLRQPTLKIGRRSSDYLSPRIACESRLAARPVSYSQHSQPYTAGRNQAHRGTGSVFRPLRFRMTATEVVHRCGASARGLLKTERYHRTKGQNHGTNPPHSPV
jgi:hypothetical protein